jgi:hypothetical protein
MKYRAVSASSTALVVCSGLLLLAILSIFAVISWPSSAVRNERTLVRLFARARSECGAGAPSRIQRVTLPGGITLIPEQEQVATGYVLKLHVRSASYIIDARPLKAGQTGVFSFLRDEGGVVRFEPNIGKPATAESPRWSPPVSEGQR